MEMNARTIPTSGTIIPAKRDGTALMMIFAILEDWIVVNQNWSSMTFVTTTKIAREIFIVRINGMLVDVTTCADQFQRNTAILRSVIRTMIARKESFVMSETALASSMLIVAEVKPTFTHHQKR